MKKEDMSLTLMIVKAVDRANQRPVLLPVQVQQIHSTTEATLFDPPQQEETISYEAKTSINNQITTLGLIRYMEMIDLLGNSHKWFVPDPIRGTGHDEKKHTLSGAVRELVGAFFDVPWHNCEIILPDGSEQYPGEEKIASERYLNQVWGASIQIIPVGSDKAIPLSELAAIREAESKAKAEAGLLMLREMIGDNESRLRRCEERGDKIGIANLQLSLVKMRASEQGKSPEEANELVKEAHKLWPEADSHLPE